MLKITVEDLNIPAYKNWKCPGPGHMQTFCDITGICVRVLEVINMTRCPTHGMSLPGRGVNCNCKAL